METRHLMGMGVRAIWCRAGHLVLGRSGPPVSGRWLGRFLGSASARGDVRLDAVIRRIRARPDLIEIKSAKEGNGRRK